MANKLPMSLRSKAGEEAYAKAKADGTLQELADVKAIKAWKYWRLIPNAFPYDTAFRRHNLLIPVRQFASRDKMLFTEWQELQMILRDYVELHYDLMIDNMVSKRSVAHHYHIHLANYHRKRDDMVL
jgi:hypothetical protein